MYFFVPIVKSYKAPNQKGPMQKKPHAKVAKAAMSRAANWVVRPESHETLGALITFSIAPTVFAHFADFA